MTGLWDIHNHILPGLDDGASCFDETFEMLQMEYEQGVRHMIFTPHQRSGMFEIPENYRIDIFQQLRDKIKDTPMKDMTFGLGCEFNVHRANLKLLESSTYRMPDCCLPDHKEAVVLAEFFVSDTLETVIKHIEILKKSGIKHIIIAHAERYKLSADDVRKLHDLAGVYIQVNSGSLIGQEGFHQKRHSNKLLKQNLIDFIGSDAHDVSNRIVNIKDCADHISLKAGEKEMRRLMMINPANLFGNA